MEHALRSLRRRAALSLDKVEQATGISKTSLSRIENGKQKPSIDAIRTLIDFSKSFKRPLTADDFVNFRPCANSLQSETRA